MAEKYISRDAANIISHHHQSREIHLGINEIVICRKWQISQWSSLQMRMTFSQRDRYFAFLLRIFSIKMFGNINHRTDLEESGRRENVFIYKSLVGEKNQHKVFEQVGT